MSADLSFTKMQGAGNDFVVIDNLRKRFSLEELIDLTPKLCNRRYGVGADGLIAIFPSDDADFEMIYRNSDGSDAGMCGNGGRCASRFATQLGISGEHSFMVHGKRYHAVVSENEVTLSLPSTPQVEEVNHDQFGPLYIAHTGTEHVVLNTQSEAISNPELLRRMGRQLREDKLFAPKGTNVNFTAVGKENAVHLVTYERGVEDITLACGTGAVASALVFHHIQYRNESALDDTGKNPIDENGQHNVRVINSGGDLMVAFQFNPATKTYHDLKLIGPAHFVFSGSIQLP